MITQHILAPICTSCATAVLTFFAHFVLYILLFALCFSFNLFLAYFTLSRRYFWRKLLWQRAVMYLFFLLFLFLCPNCVAIFFYDTLFLCWPQKKRVDIIFSWLKYPFFSHSINATELLELVKRFKAENCASQRNKWPRW